MINQNSSSEIQRHSDIASTKPGGNIPLTLISEIFQSRHTIKLIVHTMAAPSELQNTEKSYSFKINERLIIN